MLLRTQQTCSGHKVLIKHQRTCCIRQRVCCSQPTTQSWPEFPIVRTRISSRAQNRLRLGGKQLPATNNTNVAVQESLLEYICRGPLLTAAGISPQEVQQQLPVWQLLGQQLAKQLSFPHDDMTDVQKLRVYRYYLPVFFWIQRQLQQHRQAYGEQQAPPLVLGISAPQGCGKSTLVEQLEQLLTWLGITAASVSIDDFYLTNAEQTAVVAAHPDNRLLGVRGNAGTHDLALGAQTLQQLKGLKAAGHSVAVPRYDKSAFQGRGDRADPVTWPRISGPLQLVFFEGWMLGFSPVGEAAAAAVEQSLVEVNSRLGAYQEAWDNLVDSWLVIRIGDPQWVYGWQLLEALQARRANTG
eukprot:GHRR01016424.1.p1 GENE.GHRR01016424.1~~GHRR01016424.1.p1  ORF type:complete len:355 (+),score=81.51 GHRR01016424.1:153-1217(+)